MIAAGRDRDPNRSAAARAIRGPDIDKPVSTRAHSRSPAPGRPTRYTFTIDNGTQATSAATSTRLRLPPAVWGSAIALMGVLGMGSGGRMWSEAARGVPDGPILWARSYLLPGALTIIRTS